MFRILQALETLWLLGVMGQQDDTRIKGRRPSHVSPVPSLSNMRLLEVSRVHSANRTPSSYRYTRRLGNTI